jgi:hypothetical protein
MFGNPDELRKYWRSRQQKARAKAAALGVCGRCPDGVPRAGRKNCDACIAAEVEAKRRRRAEVVPKTD